MDALGYPLKMSLPAHEKADPTVPGQHFLDMYSFYLTGWTGNFDCTS